MSVQNVRGCHKFQLEQRVRWWSIYAVPADATKLSVWVTGGCCVEGIERWHAVRHACGAWSSSSHVRLLTDTSQSIRCHRKAGTPYGMMRGCTSRTLLCPRASQSTMRQPHSWAMIADVVVQHKTPNPAPFADRRRTLGVEVGLHMPHVCT